MEHDYGKHEQQLTSLEKKTDKIEQKLDTILELITDIRIDLTTNRVKLAVFTSLVAIVVSGIVTAALKGLL
jgi:energy-converting hydrogenase Eha subunit H